MAKRRDHIRGIGLLSVLGTTALVAACLIPAGPAAADDFPATVTLKTQADFLANGVDNSRTGESVSAGGDFNSDGIDDLIIGAPYGNDSSGGQYAPGEVFVVFGGSSRSGSMDLANLPAADGWTIHGPAGSHQRAGFSVTSVGDFNHDGLDDIAITSDDYYGNANSAWIVFGQSGTGGTISLDDVGTAGHRNLGYKVTLDGSAKPRVSSGGDFNGDGYADLLIGSPSSDGGHGRAYVVFGRDAATGGTPEITPDPNASIPDSVLTMEGSGDIHDRTNGSAVAVAGDFNNDGKSDIMIGAGSTNYNGGYARGTVYVVYGFDPSGTTPLDLTTVTGSAGFKVLGPDTDDGGIGGAVAGAGDVNGDGLPDIVVGAESFQPNPVTYTAPETGATWIVYGRANNTDVDLNNPTPGRSIMLSPPTDSTAVAKIGNSVSGTGDINGDGLDDVVIGSIWADATGTQSGRAYVIYGSRTPANIDLSAMSASQGSYFNEGPDNNAEGGKSVSGGFYFNDDGQPDVAVGAQVGGDNGNGFVAVMYGSAASVVAPTIAGASVSGTPKVGSTLTASTRGITGTEPISTAYQWQSASSAGGAFSDISGAVNASLPITHAYQGKYLRVVATVSNTAGSASATSDAVGPVPVSTLPPILADKCPDGSCANADLRDLDLAGLDLAGIDFHNADLSNANLTGADLTGASLSDARLVHTNLTRTNLSGANLDKAILVGAKLHKANLTDAKLKRANLSGKSKKRGDVVRPWPGADLSNANLTGANLANADLTAARLNNAKLNHAILTKATLSFAIAKHANFNNAAASHMIATYANFQSATLKKANLSHANFNFANLKGAKLAGATTAGATFVSAKR